MSFKIIYNAICDLFMILKPRNLWKRIYCSKSIFLWVSLWTLYIGVFSEKRKFPPNFWHIAQSSSLQFFIASRHSQSLSRSSRKLVAPTKSLSLQLVTHTNTTHTIVLVEHPLGAIAAMRICQRIKAQTDVENPPNNRIPRTIENRDILSEY